MGIARKLTANFVETQVDGEVLLVDLEGGELFSLSGTAREIWRAIDGTADEAAIAASLASRYEGDKQQIEADIADLLGELEAVSLVAIA